MLLLDILFDLLALLQRKKIDHLSRLNIVLKDHMLAQGNTNRVRILQNLGHASIEVLLGLLAKRLGVKVFPATRVFKDRKLGANRNDVIQTNYHGLKLVFGVSLIHGQRSNNIINQRLEESLYEFL